MKPACMKNTRKAATSTHIVLIGLTKSLALCTIVSVCAPAAESKYQFTPFIAPSSTTTRRHLPREDDADELARFLVLQSLESCLHVRNVRSVRFPFVCEL